MIVDKQLLDEISARAKANPKLRQNYDLRTSQSDHSQRKLNALEPGTIVPRHKGTTETVVVRVVLLGGSMMNWVILQKKYYYEPVAMPVWSTLKMGGGIVLND